MIFLKPTRGYAQRTSRPLEMPRFHKIESNYPKGTLRTLEKLVLGHEERAGQLLLWFGEPGTGKAHALRSLLREWKRRFSLHYISDTERFLPTVTACFRCLSSTTKIRRSS